MKAYVCDCCGRTTIIERPYVSPEGVYVLSGKNTDLCLDLCEECAENLTKAIRKNVGEE